jgi:hypothetical protein
MAAARGYRACMAESAGRLGDVRLDRHDRRRIAQNAWSALPHGGREATRMKINCAKSHHVATVYRTSAGLVYVAPIHAHSHGDKDLPDIPHGDQEPRRWFDLLDADGAAEDDELPAWCDCGHRMLSRAAVMEWLADGERRVIID